MLFCELLNGGSKLFKFFFLFEGETVRVGMVSDFLRLFLGCCFFSGFVFGFFVSDFPSSKFAVIAGEILDFAVAH